jgi:16S rRNA (guanine966-N2)-methyltransferase
MPAPPRRAASPAAPRASTRHAQAPQQVRIIGGQWKRTPLPVVDAPGLRPTPDRVRETLFNWLAHLRPDVSLWRVLDLFAGTGALGFEAASRGAAQVTLVERESRALAALRAAQHKLAATTVQVVAADGLAYAQRLPAASVDLILLDPPFGSAPTSPILQPALAACVRLLAPGGLIYVESAQPLAQADLAPLALRPIRNGRAGRVSFQLLAAGLD